MKSTLALPAYLALQKGEKSTGVGCIYVPICWCMPVMVGTGKAKVVGSLLAGTLGQ